MRNILNLKLLVVSFGLILLLAGTAQAGTQETVYPNSTGAARADKFKYETGCNDGEHYNCVSNESDESFVFDSVLIVDGQGGESFDWVLTKTWASIDSIKLLIRTEVDDIFAAPNAMDIVYWFWDGDVWAKYALRECSCPTSFTACSVVVDTNWNGDAWTQAMIESDGVDYEFGFAVGWSDTKYKLVSKLTMTVFGTEEAEVEGNPRRNREQRQRGEIRDEKMGLYARPIPADWRE